MSEERTCCCVSGTASGSGTARRANISVDAPYKRRRRRRQASPSLSSACIIVLLILAGGTVDAKGLCVPESKRRAYATILGHAEHVLGPRVLLQSLRDAGVEADLVVLLAADRADAWATTAALEGDGIKVHLVQPEELVRARGWLSTTLGSGHALADASLKSHLWSLTQYDRVVFLNSRALVLKNPDTLFACDGFCAPMTGEEGASTFSTDVMVLEPSAEVHGALLSRLGEAAAQAVPPSDAAALLGPALLPAATRARCSTFEDLEDFMDGLDGGGGGEAASAAGSSGPILVLNAAHMPVCGGGAARSAPGTCHRLPYTYAAPSADLDGSGRWRGGAVADRLGRDVAAEPHVVRFSDAHAPWHAAQNLGTQLFWRWNGHRVRLAELGSGGGGAAAVLLPLLLPCALLLMACVQMWPPGSAVARKRAKSLSPAPSDCCLLPLVRCNSGTLAKGKGPAGWAARAAPPACAAAFAVAWYALAARWSAGTAAAAASPAAAALVAHAWLAAALVAGLHAMVYAHYVAATRARTLLRDALLSGAVLSAAALAWRAVPAARAAAAAAPTGLGMCAATAAHCLGALHAGRRRRCAGGGATQVHLIGVLGTCAASALAMVLLTFAAATSPPRAWLFTAVAAARAAATVAIYVAPYAQALVQQCRQRLCAAARWAPAARSPAGKGGRGTAAAARAAALHALVHHWELLIAAAALCWVAAPLAWELRRRADADAAPAAAAAALRYQLFHDACLASDAGYAGVGRGLAAACGAAQTFRPSVTADGALCLRAADGRFLTPLRGKLLDECAPHARFRVLLPGAAAAGDGGSGGAETLPVLPYPRSGGSGGNGGGGGSSGGGGNGAAFCLYNAETGLYLSSARHPQPLCRRTEHWRITLWEL
ncbi:hypothetical protein JKP88DRAFT_350869 [Tribonema minus]|uniref:Nucleotide-diphospho-sugar transferase domain-containing protein n=1 Tax=Tribonema minus TaxID=303371 RepID=A0A835YKB0_9STRA|nr:hypothetical protein JKP88DRAFT_350869 [Tribonema minus]